MFKISVLRDRAAMFTQARAFFARKNVLEVDCPALSCEAAPIDTHIDVMRVPLSQGKTAYLHTSPEYGMKRLLSLDIGDIYQLSHVFREGEYGPLHEPEFTMVEWYRMGMSFTPFIEETCAFIRLFLGDLPSYEIRYRTVFQQYLDIDYVHADVPSLLRCAKAHQLTLPEDAEHWDKDTLLQLLLSCVAEPRLGENALCVLTGYPASQAALAQTKEENGEAVAERFEIYYKGIELANGYHELTDPLEQKKRFDADNAQRRQNGKQELPIDWKLLEALEKGIPDCCGVAVGFDRLMLLRHAASALSEVLPISWDR